MKKKKMIFHSSMDYQFKDTNVLGPIGKHWKEGIMLLVGQEGWGKTKVAIRLAVQVLRHNPKASVMYLFHDNALFSMGMDVTYYFNKIYGSIQKWFDEMYGNVVSERFHTVKLKAHSLKEVETQIMDFATQNPNEDRYVFVDTFFGYNNPDYPSFVDFVQSNCCKIALIHHIGKLILRKNETEKDYFIERLKAKNILHLSFITKLADRIISIYEDRDEKKILLKNLKNGWNDKEEIKEIDSSL